MRMALSISQQNPVKLVVNSQVVRWQDADRAEALLTGEDSDEWLEKWVYSTDPHEAQSQNWLSPRKIKKQQLASLSLKRLLPEPNLRFFITYKAWQVVPPPTKAQSLGGEERAWCLHVWAPRQGRE